MEPRARPWCPGAMTSTRAAGVLFVLLSGACSKALPEAPAKGELLKVECPGVLREVDLNKDGRADVQRCFHGEHLRTTFVDLNFDGKPDVLRGFDGAQQLWEVLDLDFDGRVDVQKLSDR